MVGEMIIVAAGVALVVGFGMSMYKDFKNSKEKDELKSQIAFLQEKLKKL